MRHGRLPAQCFAGEAYLALALHRVVLWKGTMDGRNSSYPLPRNAQMRYFLIVIGLAKRNH
jgi:hypothetical protein